MAYSKEEAAVYYKENKDRIREVQRLYRTTNPDKIKKLSKAGNYMYAKKQRDFLRAYKLKHPCIVCGEADPIVLDFDHRDPSTKEFSIGGTRQSTERLIVEIAKCDILCANCHRRKTHNDRLANKIPYFDGKTKRAVKSRNIAREREAVPGECSLSHSPRSRHQGSTGRHFVCEAVPCSEAA